MAARGAERNRRDGAEGWNRTSDTSIFSAVLYRLSYLGTPRERLAEPQSYQPDGASDKTRPLAHRESKQGVVDTGGVWRKDLYFSRSAANFPLVLR